MTLIILGALLAYGLALAGVLALMRTTSAPCSCPIPFGQWMVGERCQKHPDWETEIGR